MRDHVARLQPGASSLEDGPQHNTLRLRKARLSAEARDIAICLPVLQLPCVHAVLPFRQQEALAELMTGHGSRSVSHQLAQHLVAGNGRRPDVRLVEPKTDSVE